MRPRSPFTPNLVAAAVANGRALVVGDPEVVLPPAAAEVDPLRAGEGEPVALMVTVDEEEGPTETTEVKVKIAAVERVEIPLIPAAELPPAPGTPPIALVGTLPLDTPGTPPVGLAPTTLTVIVPTPTPTVPPPVAPPVAPLGPPTPVGLPPVPTVAPALVPPAAPVAIVGLPPVPTVAGASVVDIPMGVTPAPVGTAPLVLPLTLTPAPVGILEPPTDAPGTVPAPPAPDALGGINEEPGGADPPIAEPPTE